MLISIAERVLTLEQDIKESYLCKNEPGAKAVTWPPAVGPGVGNALEDMDWTCWKRQVWRDLNDDNLIIKTNFDLEPL